MIEEITGFQVNPRGDKNARSQDRTTRSMNEFLMLTITHEVDQWYNGSRYTGSLCMIASTLQCMKWLSVYDSSGD